MCMGYFYYDYNNMVIHFCIDCYYNTCHERERGGRGEGIDKEGGISFFVVFCTIITFIFIKNWL